MRRRPAPPRPVNRLRARAPRQSTVQVSRPRSSDCRAARSTRAGVCAARHLLARRVVVGGPADLAEDAHHGVLEVLIATAGTARRRRPSRRRARRAPRSRPRTRRRSWPRPARSRICTTQYSPLAPKTIGSPWWTLITRSSAPSLRSTSKEPSLKIGQSCRISTTRGPAMLGRGAQHLGEALAVGVQGAADERRLGTQRHRHRVERLVQRSHRRRLGDLADLRGRRVLPLGQPVDPVVEQQDRDVDVAAQRVDQVVPTDRQRVTVAGDDPHRQVLAGQRQTRSRSRARGRGWSGNRRSPSSTGTGSSNRCR